jgi:hypothetical protein
LIDRFHDDGGTNHRRRADNQCRNDQWILHGTTFPFRAVADKRSFGAVLLVKLFLG